MSELPRRKPVAYSVVQSVPTSTSAPTSSPNPATVTYSETSPKPNHHVVVSQSNITPITATTSSVTSISEPSSSNLPNSNSSSNLKREFTLTIKNIKDSFRGIQRNRSLSNLSQFSQPLSQQYHSTLKTLREERPPLPQPQVSQQTQQQQKQKLGSRPLPPTYTITGTTNSSNFETSTPTRRATTIQEKMKVVKEVRQETKALQAEVSISTNISTPVKSGRKLPSIPIISNIGLSKKKEEKIDNENLIEERVYGVLKDMEQVLLETLDDVKDMQEDGFNRLNSLIKQIYQHLEGEKDVNCDKETNEYVKEDIKCKDEKENRTDKEAKTIYEEKDISRQNNGKSIKENQSRKKQEDTMTLLPPSGDSAVCLRDIEKGPQKQPECSIPPTEVTSLKNEEISSITPLSNEPPAVDLEADILNIMNSFGL